jgi:hypothetical protein
MRHSGLLPVDIRYACHSEPIPVWIGRRPVGNVTSDNAKSSAIGCGGRPASLPGSYQWVRPPRPGRGLRRRRDSRGRGARWRVAGPVRAVSTCGLDRPGVVAAVVGEDVGAERAGRREVRWAGRSDVGRGRCAEVIVHPLEDQSGCVPLRGRFGILVRPLMAGRQQGTTSAFRGAVQHRPTRSNIDQTRSMTCLPSVSSADLTWRNRKT